MKTKKILTVLLGTAMAISMTAYGNTTQSTDDTKVESVVETEETDDVSADVEFEEEAVEEEESEESAQEITFEETTLIDNEYITFTVKSVGPEEEYSWYYDVEVEITNKSADAEYVIDIESAYVNGVEIYAHPESGVQIRQTLAAGQTTDLVIQLEDDDSLLEDNGLTEYTDIMFPVELENEQGDTIMKEMVHIYPYGEENATAYVREPLDTDQVLIDNEYVTVTVVDAFAQSGLIFYVQNKTDACIYVSEDDLTVNGKGSLMGITLEAGQSGFDKTSFHEDLDNGGWIDSYISVNEVEAGTLEFTISATDWDARASLFEQQVAVTVE